MHSQLPGAKAQNHLGMVNGTRTVPKVKVYTVVVAIHFLYGRITKGQHGA